MDPPFVGQNPNNQYPHPPIPHVPQLPPPAPHQSANGSLPPTPTVVKRRRTSATGSRGVSNLTPEQLQKKRANDREAQRAIRERTKNQIESLEKRIQELTAQQPYVELQDVIRDKELIEAENRELKRRLASISHLAQTTSVPSDSPLKQPPDTNLPPVPVNATSQSLTMHSPATTYNDPTSVRSSTSTASNYTPSPSTSKQTLPVPQPTFLHGPVPQMNSYAPPNRALDHRMGIEAIMQRSRHNSREHQSQQRTRSGSGSAVTLPQDTLSMANVGFDARGMSLPPYAMPPRNSRSSCPLDQLLLDFLGDSRRQAMDGVSLTDLAGPAYPSFISLVQPQRRPATHPLSKVFTDMLSTFPDIATPPEQVAILHVMFLFMRWQVCPTQENYNRLPEWITPRPSQLFIEHPLWIDYLPWPLMRERMISGDLNIPFDEFFIPYTTTVSLNWPYPPDDVLIRSPKPTSEESILTLNPQFEEHLYNLNNWSLGSAFAKSHPRLADTFRVVDSRRPN